MSDTVLLFASVVCSLVLVLIFVGLVTANRHNIGTDYDDQDGPDDGPPRR